MSATVSAVDESTMHTADDALASKLSAIELKYVTDNYSKYFYNQRKVRKPPIINRGYYTRVECFRSVVDHFLEATKDCPLRQILILGSGLDTLAFKLFLSEQDKASTANITTATTTTITTSTTTTSVPTRVPLPVPGVPTGFPTAGLLTATAPGVAVTAPPISSPPTHNLLVTEVDFLPMVQRKLSTVLSSPELSAQIEAANRPACSSPGTSAGLKVKIPPSVAEVEAAMEAACSLNTADVDRMLMPPPAPFMRRPNVDPSPLTRQQQLEAALKQREVLFVSPPTCTTSAAASAVSSPGYCVLHDAEKNSALYYVPHDLRAGTNNNSGSDSDSDSDDSNSSGSGGAQSTMTLGDKLKQLVAKHSPPLSDAASITANIDTTTPTLILTECVLVYMNKAATARLISSLAGPSATSISSSSPPHHHPISSTFSNYLWCSYDMVNPQDAFGRMMVRNLTALGPFSLPGLVELPLLTDRAECFTSTVSGTATTSNSRSTTATATVQEPEDENDTPGGSATGDRRVAVSMTMLTAYNKIVSAQEKQRIARLEMLDEVEEWNLLMSHYALTLSACSSNEGLKAVSNTAIGGVSCCDVYKTFVEQHSLAK